MAHRFKRYYRNSHNNDFERMVIGFLLLYAIFLFLLWHSHSPQFYTWLGFGLLFAFVLIVIIGAMRFIQTLQRAASDAASQALVKTVKELGLEDHINNFIDRFGMETNKHNWNYRQHGFDWDRLKDLQAYLKSKGLKISDDKLDDVYSILKYYIHRREQKLTMESIGVSQQKFSNLSPTDFENLLYRLFQAMGYTVQKTGKTGDQGCDLIANRDNGQIRIIIQAKRYMNSLVGNAAVQEAVAAQKFYDCNGAFVVTSSDFTKEAVALAKVNNVALVSKHRLSELLSEYLKESWY